MKMIIIRDCCERDEIVANIPIAEEEVDVAMAQFAELLGCEPSRNMCEHDIWIEVGFADNLEGGVAEVEKLLSYNDA